MTPELKIICDVCQQPVADPGDAVVTFTYRPNKQSPPNKYRTVHKDVCDKRPQEWGYIIRAMELTEFLQLNNGCWLPRAKQTPPVGEPLGVPAPTALAAGVKDWLRA